MSKSREIGTSQPDSRGNYGRVLVSLLVLLGVAPFVTRGGGYYWIVNLAFVATIASAVWEATRNRVWLWLVALAVAGEILGAISDREFLALGDTSAHALRALTLFGVVYAVLRDVLASKRVTTNTVFAAGAVYLFIALAWASAYSALEEAAPGSFNLTASMKEADLVYFSMITITTVGFGDVAPISAQAKMLSALEAVIGQLYIAIVLARMVALEITERRSTT